MNHFKQISTFVAVSTKGSLSAAAREEGVAPAVISRRLDALEERLGVKLLLRTTRSLNLTHEGSAFLEDCQRILNDLSNAEASVSLGGIKASGHLRVSAPGGFGRAHVAPLIHDFVREHPEVSVSLDLSDRVVDLLNEGIDCAVRIGVLADSSLVGVKLADNQRLVVATPRYLERHGTPHHPDDLLKHNCLNLASSGAPSGWLFTQNGLAVPIRVSGNLACNDGSSILDWVLNDAGLAWRSRWEVQQHLRSGKLVTVLDQFVAPPNAIYAVFPQRKYLPLRVRLWIDFLKHRYSTSAYWN
ncbi:LysR family transcriptional regulator [Limnobacter parvus]|uniref:LysR family transcriptional regulator n=1 Tax=Limnobacter parvus TaxID=2939690 RepID=A0ABT1XH35_9BURK|nr:LysR family transcriptional regulator [Limnobacter parvus]MCR2746474.1 LysR family transcriptional regulator [Limnobacter parvus]